MSEEKKESKYLGLKNLRAGGSKTPLQKIPCPNCGKFRYNPCGCKKK